MRSMSLEPAGDADAAFDLSMAVSQLASNSTDLRIMLKVLAGQLSEVLGHRVAVERAGGRFRKSDEIKSLRSPWATTSSRPRRRAVGALHVGHSSGGIRIRSEQVEMDTGSPGCSGPPGESAHSERPARHSRKS